MEVDRLIKKIEKNQTITFNDLNFLTNDKFNIEDYREKFTEEIVDKLKTEKLISTLSKGAVSLTQENLDFIFLAKKPNESVLKFFGLENISKKNCNFQELMTIDDPVKYCFPINLELVRGSCDKPLFFNTNNDISEDKSNKYIELFNAIETKLLKENTQVYLDIVVGATTKLSSEFKDKAKTYCLIINPDETKFTTGVTIEKLIETINSTDSLLNKTDILINSFPLSHNFKNSKKVLDKLILMNENANLKIRLINRMCGTCFRSFYYLVKNDIMYKVDAEQGLNDDKNTPSIRSCFK